MKIPYGISNFKDLITGGYVYIDKTDYIAKLEEAGKYHILLRPRRFGKSLMLSALEYYYDIGSKTDFDAIFSKLYIGKHPTPLQSSYQVLFMEFSGIETGSHEQILSGFNVNVNIYLQAFLRRYGYGADAIAGLADCPAPADKLKHVFNVASGKKSCCWSMNTTISPIQYWRRIWDCSGVSPVRVVLCAASTKPLKRQPSAASLTACSSRALRLSRSIA